MSGAGKAFLPFYSTAYGDTFGYNERAGNNVTDFRNRYQNTGYRGSIGLGPSQRCSSSDTFQSITEGSTEPLAATLPIQYNYPPPAPYHLPTVDSSRSTNFPSENRHQGDVFQNQEEYASSSFRPRFPTTTQSLSQSQSIPQSRSRYSRPKSPERRPPTPPYNLPGLTYDKVQSMQNFGKQSISRRLPSKTRLRYHVPGYMGFVHTIQYRHGDTFGRTTRKCLLDHPA